MINIEKIGTQQDYKLELNGFVIYVTVKNGKIYLSTYKNESKFIFQNSQPETLEHIGLLIIKASKFRI